MKIEHAYRNHIGLLRPRNEDACCASLSEGDGEPHGGVFAVADGMGGHPGGEVASSLAIAAVVESRIADSVLPPLERLRRLFRAASDRIEQRSAREPQNREMGTTLTVALIDRGRLWVGHIGDCRLYWIRQRREVQITRDHTMAQDMVDAGLLLPAAAERHPASHVLTRCLGACPDQAPDLLELPLALETGDRLLLASDGLVKAVRPSELADLLRGHSPDSGADRLLEAALSGGAPDNVTVVVVEVLEADPTAASDGAVDFAGTAELRWSRG